MKFRVLNPDGSVPDLEQIALNEEWAGELIYCDTNGFALADDGALVALDECGRYAYPPIDRFRVVMEPSYAGSAHVAFLASP